MIKKESMQEYIIWKNETSKKKRMSKTLLSSIGLSTAKSVQTTFSKADVSRTKQTISLREEKKTTPVNKKGVDISNLVNNHNLSFKL